MPPATSYDLRDKVVYELIHDVRSVHWDWFFAAGGMHDGDVVLDCGCGYGACTREMLARHPDATFSVDLVDESAVQLARAKSDIKAIVERLDQESKPSGASVLRFCHAALADLTATRRQYDVIMLKMVLHEVARNGQQTFLDHLHGLLKPGGVLLIWDLALDPSVAPFFRDVIRRKDELLEFRTLADRRYFLTAAEFLELASNSEFGGAEVVRIFDCDFYSERRLECEFKGDIAKYQTWLRYLQQQIASLTPEERSALDTVDRTNDPDLPQVKFSIKRGIWRMRRPDAVGLLNSITIAEQIHPHLEPSSGRADLVPTFQNAVRKAINAVGHQQLLPGHKGLIRVTTFDLKDKGRRELSKSGTDYVYSFSQDRVALSSPFNEELVAAYFRHMCYIYHRKRLKRGVSSDTLTDYLNEKGRFEPNLTSLRFLRPYPIDPRKDEIHVTLRTGSSVVVDVLDITELDAWCEVLESIYRMPQVGITADSMSEEQNALRNTYALRLECGTARISVDLTAQATVAGIASLPEFPGTWAWVLGGLRDLPLDALLGFAAFLKKSGLRFASYIMPPAPLENSSGRKNLSTVFFSSDCLLNPEEEDVVLAFASKMWGEMRGLELVTANTAFVNVAYKEEILNRSAEKKFFMVELVLPLFCGAEREIKVTDLIRTANEPTRPVFNEWASNWSVPFTRRELPVLLQYLQLERDHISTGEREVLEAIHHELSVVNNVDGAALGTRINRALQLAKSGGVLFEKYARLLNLAANVFAETEGQDAALSILKEVRERLTDLGPGSRMPILELCKGHQSKPRAVADFCQVGLDPDALPQLRFRLSELQATAAALRNNAASKNRNGDYSLRYAETDDSCCISWLESVARPWTLDEFAKTLLASARSRGVHRGLPRVVLFGFESGAQKIEFLSDDNWVELWPSWGLAAPSPNAHRGYNYGYRFTI